MKKLPADTVATELQVKTGILTSVCWDSYDILIYKLKSKLVIVYDLSKAKAIR